MSWAEFVPYAVDGQDVFWIFVVLFYFLAQFHDEVVNRAIRRKLFGSPDLVQDLVAADRLAGIRI